jgi:outer membrane protein insertion porin family
MKLAALAIAGLFAAPPGGAQTAHQAATKPAPAEDNSAMIPLEGQPWPIETVTVQGNHVFTAKQILTAAGLQVGQVAGKLEFDAARDRLVATGAFDNVSYQFAPAKDFKGYNATVEVAEMAQMYPLRFEELPAADADLRAWLQERDPLFGEKIPATKPEIDRYVRWISEYLAGKNYREPVSGKLSSDTTAELMIVFRPAKARPNIARVKFSNTGDVPSGTLQTAMFGVAVGVPYTEAQLRVLLGTTIRPIYEARGMIRVAFGKVETQPSKDVDGVDVSVDVVPGPVYKLGRVRFAGYIDDDSPQSLAKLANLKTDQAANFDEVKAAQEKIALSLRRRGYLNAASDVQRDVKDAEKIVNITLQINPGPLFTLGKLDIVGLDIETEPVIRKMWSELPGQPFNPEYPDHFLKRVKDGGVFDNLKNSRPDTKIDATKHTVDVTLYFNEKTSSAPK